MFMQCSKCPSLLRAVSIFSWSYFKMWKHFFSKPTWLMVKQTGISKIEILTLLPVCDSPRISWLHPIFNSVHCHTTSEYINKVFLQKFGYKSLGLNKKNTYFLIVAAKLGDSPILMHPWVWMKPTTILNSTASPKICTPLDVCGPWLAPMIFSEK